MKRSWRNEWRPASTPLALWIALGFIVPLTCHIALGASAEKSGLKGLSGVAFDQRLDAAVPLSAVFCDENGKSVQLSSFFHGKPVILATVYYSCPMLCSQILSGIVRSLRPLSLVPGRDFEIVAISINPAETPQDAKAKQELYSHNFSKTAGTAGWNFLVGTEPSIRAVTDAIGFHYKYDPATKMYFHASGITVLTPEGHVSRYLYGVDYEPKDVKLALMESSQRRIGSAVDQVLLFCYHYDPKTGKYGAAVLNLLKLTAGVLLAIMVGLLAWLWRRDIRQYSHPFTETKHI